MLGDAGGVPGVPGVQDPALGCRGVQGPEHRFSVGQAGSQAHTFSLLSGSGL